MAITLQELLVKVSADISDYTQGLDDAISKGQQAEGALAGIAEGMSAAFTVPLAAVGVAAMEAASQVKEAMNTIIVQTGAAGDQLASLKGTFAEVFASVPQSASDVAAAISQIAVRLDLTGEPLQNLSQQFLELAHITGQQVAPLIDTTTKAFRLWQVATADQSGELDKLFNIAQRTGTSVSTLASGLQEYGAKFQTMGLNFDQAAALLGTFEKAGINASQVMTGLNKALAQMGKAGLDTSQGFASIVNYIHQAATEADGLQRAINLFGAKAGTSVFQAIQSGALDFANLAKLAGTTGDSIVQTAERVKTLGESMTEAWHKVELALAPIGQLINSTLRDAFNTVAGPVIEKIGQLAHAFQDLPVATQRVTIGIAAIAAAAGPAILAVEKLGGAALRIGSNSIEGITAFGSAISNVVYAVQNGLTGALTGGEALLLRFGQAALIAGAAFVAFESVKSVIQSIGDLTDALSRNLPSWDSFTATVKGAFTDIETAVAKAASGIASAISSLIPPQVAAEVAAAIAAITSPLTGLIAALAHFKDTQLTSGLWDNIKSGARDALGPIMALADAFKQLSAFVEAWGGNYKSMNDAVTSNLNRVQQANKDLMKPPDWRSTVGGGNTLENEAAKNAKLAADQLDAAKKAAKEFANALETVGIAGLHTEKLTTAMDLVTKGFEAGRLSASQYGEAISNVIEKQIQAADKLGKSTTTVTLDKSALADFKGQLDSIDQQFAKGKLNIGQYEDALHNLQLAFHAANGTSLDNALKSMGIPTSDDLARQARYFSDFYNTIAHDSAATLDQIQAAWQKYFAAQQKLQGTRLNALAGLGIVSQDKLDHSLQMAQAYYAQLQKAGNATYAELDQAQQKVFQALQAAAQGSDAAQYALKALGIPSQTALDNAAAQMQKYYAAILSSATSTFAQIDQAQQKLFQAQQAALQNTSAADYALKMLGIPSQPQLDNAEQQAAKFYLAILTSAQSTFAQIDQAQQKLFQAQQAVLQNTDPAAYAMKMLGIPNQQVLDNAVQQTQKYYDAIRQTATSTFAQIDQAEQRLFAAQQNAAQNVNASDYALKMLGIPSNAQIDNALKQAEKYYEAIQNTAFKTITQVEAAWQKLFAAQVAASPTLSAQKFLGIPTDEEIQHSISMVTQAYKTLVAAYEDGQISQFTLEKANLAELQKIVSDQQQAGVAMTIDQGRQLELLSENIAKANLNVWGSIHQEVKTVMDTLDTGLADAVLHLNQFGDKMISVLTNIADQVLTTVFKTLTKPLTDTLTKVLTDALAPIGQNLSQLLGFLPSGGGLVAGGITGAMPAGVTSGGAATAAINSVVPGAATATNAGTSAGAGASQTGAGAASSAASGLAGIANIANIANAAISLVSGIVQGFQMARLENTMNAVEHNTRYLQIEAEKFFQQDEWQRQAEILTKFDEMYQMVSAGFNDLFMRLGDIWYALGGAVGSTANGPGLQLPDVQNLVPATTVSTTSPATPDYSQYNAAQAALADASNAAAGSTSSLSDASQTAAASVSDLSTAVQATIDTATQAATSAARTLTDVFAPAAAAAQDLTQAVTSAARSATDVFAPPVPDLGTATATVPVSAASAGAAQLWQDGHLSTLNKDQWSAILNGGGYGVTPSGLPSAGYYSDWRPPVAPIPTGASGSGLRGGVGAGVSVNFYGPVNLQDRQSAQYLADLIINRLG